LHAQLNCSDVAKVDLVRFSRALRSLPGPCLCLIPGWTWS